MRLTTPLYWDCECDKDYIRPNTLIKCGECGARSSESPDSRIDEVLAAGLDINGPSQSDRDAYSSDAQYERERRAHSQMMDMAAGYGD